jgi:hypothetical protein
MSINSNARRDTVILMLPSKSHADTTAATSAWFDTASYKGDIIVTHNVGAVTTSITSKLRSATSDAGAGAADITGATFTACTDADHVESVVVAAMPARYIQYVGTVVGGAVLLGVTLRAATGQATG